MVDKPMLRSYKQLEGAQAWSFLFGGIGDARHLFATMMVIGLTEATSASGRRYHFSLNDITSEVLARDLIFFLLLDRLSHLHTPNKEQARLLHTLYYVYIAQVLPPEAYNCLQETIDRAVKIMEGQSLAPEWLYFKPKEPRVILQILSAWKTKVPERYRCADFTKEVRKSFSDKRLFFQSHDLRMPVEKAPRGCQAEYRDWKDSCLLLTPELDLDEQIRKLMESATSAKRSRELQRYVDETWKPNVTLVGLQHIDTGDEQRPGPNVGMDVFQIAENLYKEHLFDEPSDPCQLFDYVKPFFEGVSHFIRATRGRFTVEFLEGDITDVLEQLQYGTINDRDETFPTRFDRIHLNNIP